MGGRPAWRGTPSEPGRDLETVLVGFWDRPRDRREHAKEHRRFGLDVRVTEFPMISDVGGAAELFDQADSREVAGGRAAQMFEAWIGLAATSVR